MNLCVEHDNVTENSVDTNKNKNKNNLTTEVITLSETRMTASVLKQRSRDPHNKQRSFEPFYNISIVHNYYLLQSYKQ